MTQIGHQKTMIGITSRYFSLMHSILTLNKLKICFGGAYFKNLISYDQSAFSAYIGFYNSKLLINYLIENRGQFIK